MRILPGMMRSAAAALAMMGFLAPPPHQVVLPKAPTTGVERPPSKRRKDPNDRKRKKALKQPRPVLVRLGFVVARKRRWRDLNRHRIVTIHQAMRAGGARVSVNPVKYRNSNGTADAARW